MDNCLSLSSISNKTKPPKNYYQNSGAVSGDLQFTRNEELPYTYEGMRMEEEVVQDFWSFWRF